MVKISIPMNTLGNHNLEVNVSVEQVAETDAVEKIKALQAGIDYALSVWNEGEATEGGGKHDVVDLLQEVVELMEGAERARKIAEQASQTSSRWATGGSGVLNTHQHNLKTAITQITGYLNITRELCHTTLGNVEKSDSQRNEGR